MNAPIHPGQFADNLSALPTHIPLMTRERFAEQVGVSDGVVQGWIARGYIPVYVIGKYRLINVTALCLSLANSHWTEQHALP